MNSQALRIYAHAPARPTLARPHRTPPPKLVCIVEPVDAEHFTCEPHVIAILERPPHPGETIEIAYRRKERELVDIFRTLDRATAAALHRRLSEPRTDDELATRFARLLVERRTRLLAVLADAPRRDASRR